MPAGLKQSNLQFKEGWTEAYSARKVIIKKNIRRKIRAQNSPGFFILENPARQQIF
jgi:hypothetical protein